ncbi:hypothetical protein, partial [Rhizobium sp. PP-CC-3G-465]|uniref:hypothetical protein n=1 Tax=Rhizobium sp. PP-CC-3G-465 TaxID=2135648 RepID=UPI001A9E28E5
PRAHRQRLAKQRSRCTHALELRELNGLSLPLTNLLAGRLLYNSSYTYYVSAMQEIDMISAVKALRLNEAITIISGFVLIWLSISGLLRDDATYMLLIPLSVFILPASIYIIGAKLRVAVRRASECDFETVECNDGTGASGGGIHDRNPDPHSRTPLDHPRC